VARGFLDALALYSWPGNVRGLENVLERALILSRSDLLTVESLPAQILLDGREAAASAASRTPAGAPPLLDADPRHTGHEESPAGPPVLAGPLEEAEYKALVQALSACGGHRERTAEILGVSRRTLQYKLKRFGLARKY
jgi:two-component system NtrC family response regulator